MLKTVSTLRKIQRIKYLLFLCFLTNTASAQHQKEILLESGWKFSRGDFHAADLTSFNDSRWQRVRVPHDWAIYGPFDQENDAQLVKISQNGEKIETKKTGRTGALPYMGIAWYRTRFSLTGSVVDKQVSLMFDGVMSNATVFVNGKLVGKWAYGYTSFYFDITSFLVKGKENLLSVRVDNKPESSRWYPGAGIYRNVHLLIKDQVNIKVWGTAITSQVLSKAAAVVKVKSDLSVKQTSDLRLVHEIVDESGNKIAKSEKGDGELLLPSPRLWSPEQPYQYTLITRLFKGNVLKDLQRTRFGIRTTEFRRGSGFWLNGNNIKFKGVCLHHDLGPLGSAINVSAMRRQLRMLKAMGCNAIRTSHNPVAPEFLNLCDEMGFMVIEEAFDEWNGVKMKNGYHLYFKEWAEKDVVNMIRRDRNHPSIIMWSIGNEVPEQHWNDGYKTANFLQDICHSEDPTRLVTAGIDGINSALGNGFAGVLDVAGFNYKPRQYREAYERLPQGFLYGSETASTVSSRGFYGFPVIPLKDKQYPNGQSSSYDLEACNWSQVPDDEFVVQDTSSYVAGEFVWTGFDYLGEPTPYDTYWPSRSSYFGIVDLAGLPKDRYYLYKSRWNKREKTLHLLPHWNWPDRLGKQVPIFCYTNYPSAELFVNGKSMGVKRPSKVDNQSRYRLIWDEVYYQPGRIKVVAYDEKGRPAASREIRTAGQPYQLQLRADRLRLTPDGKDLSFITVSVVDRQGNLCPNDRTSLSFEVTGAGRFRAACNGDPTSLELFHRPVMHAFNGKLVAIVESLKATKGTLKFKASGPSLQSATLEIVVK